MFGNGTKCTLLAIDYTITPHTHTHTTTTNNNNNNTNNTNKVRATICLAASFCRFATTMDIERALHPPDKQDLAARLLLDTPDE